MEIDPPNIMQSIKNKYNNTIRLITAEPTVKPTLIIKPIAINKSHSISPEPLLKRMRLT